VTPRSQDGDAVRVSAVRTPDGVLRAAVRGRGPALLCVHGLTAHAAVWERVAPLLEDRFTLVLPDLLGRGRSDAAPGASYRLEAEVERLAAVARELAPGPLLVLGHSHGAALSVALAAREERCRALCLLGPVTPWTPRPALLGLLRRPGVRRRLAHLVPPLRRPVTRLVLRRRVFADPAAVDEAAVRRYADPWGRPGRPETLLRILSDWRPGDLGPHLPSGRRPALVLTGEHDRRAPPPLAWRLAAALGCDLRVVPGAAHALPEEAPRTVARAVEELAREAAAGTDESPGHEPTRDEGDA